MQKKNQHTVPECYLKAFVDPKTPKGMTPYVWIIDRATKTPKRKSPKKVFTESDIYTFKISKDNRNLAIEDTLSKIEDDFTRILKNSIIKGNKLTDRQKIYFALFISALWSRTLSKKKHWESQLEEIAEVAEFIEKQHGIPSTHSQEIRDYIPDAHKYRILNTLVLGANIILTKGFTFFTSTGNYEFITSDDPVTLFNPSVLNSNFYTPAPIDPKTDFFIPLTPKIAFYAIGNSDNIYIPVDDNVVNVFNHRTARHCDEYIISAKKEPDLYKVDTESIKDFSDKLKRFITENR